MTCKHPNQSSYLKHVGGTRIENINLLELTQFQKCEWIFSLHGTYATMRETRTASARRTATAVDNLGFLTTFRINDGCFVSALNRPSAEADPVAEACRGIGRRSSAPAKTGCTVFTAILSGTLRFESNVNSRLKRKFNYIIKFTIFF